MPKRRGNGEGSVVKYKDGYRAIIVTGWKDSAHPIKHTKAGFRTAKAAREYIYAYKRQEVRKPKTLGDYWNAYSSAGLLNLSRSKQTHFRTVWSRLEHLRSKEVVSLEVAEVQEVVNRYTYYPARDIKTLVSHLYKLAIADGEAQRNLSEALVLPPLDETPTVPFTTEQIVKMWEDYRSHPITGVALLMIYTGLMPAEVASITRDNVDFEQGIITGVGVKTARRREAFVVLPDVIYSVVEELFARGKRGGLLPCSVDAWRKEFKQMVARIGAPSSAVPYSCRVTYATVISTQVSPTTLAQLMRNSIEVTDRYYVQSEVATLRNEVNSALKTITHDA